MSEQVKKILSPVVQIVDDLEMGKVLILKEPWNFTLPNGEIITIPVGFRSDGESIPRFLWRVLSPQIDFITLGPSIEHDYRYDQKIGTRKECDLFYRDRLIENGYPKVKAYVTYWGVRLGGSSHY